MTDRKTPPPTDAAEGRASSSESYTAREIDATAMKAFAHPLRMEMYEWLGTHGPATATMLARHTGESTGQTSYHLRQLARHGFVEEDAGRGRGRERWWRAVGFSVRAALMSDDDGLRPAVDLMLRAQQERRSAELAEWLRRASAAESAGGAEKAWVDASTNSRTTATMTALELDALRDAVMRLVHEHTERAKERRGVEGAVGAGSGVVSGSGDAAAADPGAAEESRRVRVYFDAFPLPAEE